MLLYGAPHSGACVRCFDESQQPSESATLDNMAARSTWSNVQLSGNSNCMTHSRGQGKLERCASLFHLVAELACQRFRDDCDSPNPSIALLEGGHGGQHQRQLARVQNLQPRRTTTPNKIKSFSRHSQDLPADSGKDLPQTFPGPPPDFGKTFIVSSSATSFKAIPSDRVEEQLECNEYSAALSSWRRSSLLRTSA